MKGFGCYGYGKGGGSSPSSSNLSALAPPFTVDRSAAKTCGEPLMNSNLWTPSPHVPDYFSNPSVDNVSLPPNSVPKYPSSQYADPYLNYKELSGASFRPYSDSGKNSLNGEKAYYPSYVSPAIGEGSTLVSLNDSGYDWSCNSGVATLSGSMNDEYTRSLSGLQYPSQWGGFWNGTTGSESARSDGLDKSFSGPYFNLDCLKQGMEEPKDVSVHASPSVSYVTDAYERKNHLGSFCSPSEYKFSASNFCEFIPSDSSAADSSGAPSVAPGIHLIESSPKPGVRSWSSQFPYTPSNEERIKLHELESVVKPSPLHVICPTNASKSPLVSPRIQPQSGIEMPFSCSDKTCVEHHDFASVPQPSSRIVIKPPTARSSCSYKNCTEFFGNDLAGKIMDVAEDDLHAEKDLSVYPCSEWNNQRIDNSSFGSHIEKNDYTVADRPSTIKEPSCNGAINKDAYTLFEPRIELQAAQIRKPDSYDSAADDLYQHNPAEDSPCWKGAPSVFSSFGNSEPASSQHLLKKLDSWQGSGLHGVQICPLETVDELSVLPKKIGDDITYKRNMPVDYVLLSSTRRPSIDSYRYEEHSVDLNGRAGFGSLNASCANGDITESFTQESRTSDHPTSRLDTNTGYKHFKSLHQDRTPNYTMEEKQSCGISAADTRMNLEDTLQNGLSGVSYDSAKKVISSPASGEDILAGLAQPSGGVSAPELKFNMLVLTMQNLSDILLSRCSDGPFLLKNEDSNTLKHVISNLHACLDYGNQKHPTKETFSEPGSSYFSNEDKNVNMYPELASASIHSAAVNPGLHVPRGTVMDSGNEKLKKMSSLNSDADPMAQEYMTQAIKKILSDHLHYDEETQPEVLLYRNLWLEAEAEICSTNYKARFDRMKISMKKCRSPESEATEKISGNSKVSTSYNFPCIQNDVKKLSSCKVTAGQSPHKTVVGMQHLAGTSASTTSYPDEVMTRLHILKSRDDNSISGLGQEEQAKSAANCKDLLSSDVSVESQLCPEAGEASYANIVEDSVMARFQILNSRAGNFMTNAVDTEDQLTHKVTPDDSYFDAWASHANDHSSPDSSAPFQGFPFSNKVSEEENNDNALMDRVNILIRRDENSRCTEDTQGQQMPEFCELGFIDSRNNSPPTDDEMQTGSLKTTKPYELQHSDVDCIEGTTARMEPHVRIEDHVAMQSFKKDRPGHQFSAGWYDSSSSEWEHVLKDEITYHNDGTRSTA